MSFTLNPDLTEAERGELAVEVQFYGLLHLMMPTLVPYYAQEQIGVALLPRACVVGTQPALQSAMATARAMVFEMGSTTPWLVAKYQDLRYVITDRVVSGAPVWAAEDGEQFMYRARNGQMLIGIEANCAAGNSRGVMYNGFRNPDVLAPTKLPTNAWRSGSYATLGPQYTSAGGADDKPWVGIPDMSVTAVHGLPDDEPAMVAALRQLADMNNERPRKRARSQE